MLEEFILFLKSMTMNAKKKKYMLPTICGLFVHALIPLMAQAQDGTVQFDTSVLKDRGLDSSLGNYFSDAAKFLPGRKPVNLRINGNDKGTVTALFGKKGELCVDRDFLQSAGLQVPSELNKEPVTSNGAPENESCYDYHKDYPNIVITPVPGEERLDMVVPEEALANVGLEISDYQKGGTAGLFNYDIFSTKNTYDGDSNDYSQASLEEGLNMDDWLVRSRQILTKNDGDFNANSLYTYVQHTFAEQKKMMQAGQINITNTLFSGAAINGVQFVPDTALAASGGSGVTVQGIAQGPQARVEVRQAGTLVYSTLVPMGPFSLDNVPITSVNTALDVTVKETNGNENHFIIPAESLHPNQLGGPQGFSIAAGQVRDVDTSYEKPYLVTASSGWKVTNRVNTSAGVMAATKYQAVGGSVDVSPFPSLLVSTAMTASDDQRGNGKGTSTTLRANYTGPHLITLSASATNYTTGYRELVDTLQDDFVPYSGQYSTNMGWGNDMLGTFSLGYTFNKGVKGDDDSRYVSLAWGKSYRAFTVSANWQSQINRHDDDDSHHTNGDQFYVNLSIPIGSHNVNAYWRKQGDSENAGLETSDTISPEMSYSVAAERDIDGKENNFNGSISDNLHYTQLGLSAGMNGTDSKNYGMTLSGGVVAHPQGVTFSPYRVEDTFAVADLNEKVDDVQISTPSGNVWTDHWGRAVIPSLPAYHNARIEINTESLPKNIDVNNAMSMVSVGRGAVSHIQFGVINVRRVMLNVSDRNGRKLAKGTTIVDAEGNYIVTAVDDGLVFLSDVDKQPKLFAVGDDGKHQCQLQYTLPKERDLNVFYEKVDGVCQ